MRSVPDYNAVSFPHCKCDARKVGHVIVILNAANIRLRACTEEGALEEQEHSFAWELVCQHEADMEESAFIFQYNREKKGPRWVRVYSPYVSTKTIRMGGVVYTGGKGRVIRREGSH